jgi:hypothetical protein
MRKIKEVLRLRFELGLGQRQIARSCGMGLGTVHEYLERAVAAGIGWPLPEGLGQAVWQSARAGRSGATAVTTGLGYHPSATATTSSSDPASLRHFLARLGRIDVLVIDDWAMAPLNENERREVWEICEDRYQTPSTILTSQLPVSRWHEQIGDPTIADSILDRLVHNAHRIEMRGESMRKKRNPPQDEKKE